jgi:hypothetical protein
MNLTEQHALALALQAWADIIARRHRLGLIARNNLAWAHVRAAL